MKPDAVGLPINAAVERGLLREWERVVAEHVPSGRRLIAWVGRDGAVRSRHGIMTGCVTVSLGVTDPAARPPGTEP